MSHYSGLRQNIHSYIKRYYLAQVIGGFISTMVVTGLIWLAFVLFEYLLSFGIVGRTILFYSFIAVAMASFTTLILIPILKMAGLMPSKSEKDAAREIGNQVSALEDKLMNYIDLESISNSDSDELTRAAVEQKSGRLNTFAFDSLVNLKKRAESAKYLLIPIAIIFIFWMVDPDMIPEGSNRMIHYSDSFTPKAPFDFVLENTEFSVNEGEILNVRMRLVGNSIPDNAYILLGSEKYRMKSVRAGQYEFQIDHTSTDIKIQFEAAGFISPLYKFRIIRIPKLLQNRATLYYPDYTGIEKETLINRHQLKVPEGTRVDWEFEAKNANHGSAYIDGRKVELTVSRYLATYNYEVKSSSPLKLIFSNDEDLKDTSSIEISMVKDAFPSITAQELVDSISTGVKFFHGDASDDYGISRLFFIIQKATNTGTVTIGNYPIDIPHRVKTTKFNFFFLMDTISLNKAEHLEYYFQVWDNDGVNGSKSTNSKIWTYQPLTQEELQVHAHKQDQKSKDALEEELKELQETKKEIEQLKENVVQKKKPDWQDKETLKRIIEDQQKAMQRLMDEALKQRSINEQNNRKSNYSEQLLEKQERIQEMFERLFDNEFKEKFQEYQDLLEELSKQQFMQKLDEMELNNESLEKEMDRTLELFKQLEFEKKLEENIDKVDKMIEDQNTLLDKTKQNSIDSKGLSKNQEELKNQMDKLSEDIREMRMLNDAMEESADLPDTKQEETEALENMKTATDELNDNNRKNAGKNQENAKKALQKLSEKMKSMQADMEAESQGENLENMRQILENLVDLSTNQEAVMEKLKMTKSTDPKYMMLAKSEKAIIDDTEIVEDSLLALSKRVPQLDRIINEEIAKAKYSMSKSLEHITNQPPHQEEQYRQFALVDQQLAMTSLNNLAVIIDEAIRQLQQQMQSQMKGSGQCNKPGNGQSGKPSLKNAMQRQQNLNEKIEEMRKALEKGKSPGGEQPGTKPGGIPSISGVSKELARMAAEQAAIREQLRSLENEINSRNGKYSQELKELEKMMEESEEEIIYQKITQQTLERQQEIMTKLLESEKAQREREFDNRRESENSENKFLIPEDLLEKFEQIKLNETEMYRTLPPNLKPFYRNEVNRYFSTFVE